MKKILQSLVFIFLFCLLAAAIRAEKLEIGTKFPIEKLGGGILKTDDKIVVFIPSLTDECEYASMLTQSFYYYFNNKLAFEGLKKNPTTQIFLIVKDKLETAKSPRSLTDGMKIIYDENGELFSSFGVVSPASKNADSTVILLDSQNNVVHLDEHYRAQGEHLKPLENKLKQLNGIYRKVESNPARKVLQVGDLAPDFKVNAQQKLSDLRGDVVLVSFYPAAFSGTLPRSSQNKTSDNLSIVEPLNAQSLMSCSVQITSISSLSKPSPKAKRIVVSGSTPSLLSKWKEVLGTQGIEYTNDPDYSISSGYFSYNPAGYNNRVSVIVDQKGRIAYIDNKFDFNDQTVLNAKMDELLKSDK